MKTRTRNSRSQRALAIAASLLMFAVTIFAQGSKAPVKTDTKILYHDGPVMKSSANIIFLLQQNWVNARKGYCSLATPGL